MDELERQFKEAIIESWYVFGRAKDVTHGADMAWDATKHLFQMDDDKFWRELYHQSMRNWSQNIVEVQEWRRRHGEHAGHAPLSELDEILEGKYGDS